MYLAMVVIIVAGFDTGNNVVVVVVGLNRCCWSSLENSWLTLSAVTRYLLVNTSHAVALMK